ncbi:MAG: rhodanese-like domain-containing protein [candidate division NC10 bacterium]|nr:rhodanese-like domain-containing protein [candidate division NC10 bacterium]
MITLCEHGIRSLRAAQFLLQMGIDPVTSVKGGTAAWRAAGKPLAFGDTRLEKPRVTESEWTHAGASRYSI